jgi:hypothetical protein
MLFLTVSRKYDVVSLFRETRLAETSFREIAEQAKRPLLFRKIAKQIPRNISHNLSSKTLHASNDGGVTVPVALAGRAQSIELR